LTKSLKKLPTVYLLPILLKILGSYDQSPRLMEVYGESEGDLMGVGSQLREDLAEAMLEGPAGGGHAPPKEAGESFAPGRCQADL